MKRLISKTSLLLGICALSISSGLLLKSSPLIKASAATLEDTGDLYGGAHISFRTTSETDVPAKILFDVNGEGGESFAGTGIYLRMKNYTGIDTYINMYLRSLNGARRGPRQDVRQTYFNASGTQVTYDTIPLRDFNNYLILPANFDGYIYMNYTDQMTKAVGSNDKTFSYAAVTMYMEISALYDTFANFAIGDIYTNSTKIFDGSGVSDENFAKTFTENGTDYLYLDRMSKDDNHEPKGDLLGSVNVKTKESGGGFHVFLGGKSVENDGVYVRVRNNNSQVYYITTHYNSRNNGRVTNKPNENYYLYDNAGKNRTTCQFDAVNGGRLAIPANFDGFLFLPVASYEHNTTYSSQPFDPTDIYAVYFEGYMNDIDFGDMTTRVFRIFDGSEYYPEDLNDHVVVDWDCTLTLNEGHLIPEVPPFDYGAVTYLSDLEQGGQVTCVRDTVNNTIAYVDIILPEVVNFSSALAITVRMKAIAGDFPFFFRISDDSGNVSELPSNTSPDKAKYVTLAGNVTNASTGGNDHSIKYPNGFDGNLIIPLDILSNYTPSSANLERVKSFRIGVAVYYDYDFNAIFGDIGYIVEATSTHVIALDVSEQTFENVFVVDNATKDYIKVKKYFPPEPCPWIGDVKVLNPLNYPNDEKLKQEVVWDAGDNLCSYSVMDDGMFVHIGPFETGHTYGSYMCLQIDEKGVYTDRKVWSKEEGGQKVLAKGITAYVKNLSKKDIGITLQIDEVTDASTLERWCITGYPAMYYAWDVKTNAEYTFYCKSDQFQIPVGFEGYVRIPFESYRVPDWCQPISGVDNVLNIEKWSGKFYLTSDNTRFEDLEYFIKNIGVYFNETRCSTLFDSSHSIKSNMGL